jgi:WD40 repeat protein
LLLAASAVDVTTAAGEPATTPALQALRDVLSHVGGQPIAGDDWRAQKTIVSPDGRWLVADCSDKTLRLWDLQKGFSMADATVIEDWLGSRKSRIAAFSDDNHWLVTLHPDESLRLWDLTSADFSKPAMHLHKSDARADSISAIVFGENSEFLVARSNYTVKKDDPSGTGEPAIFRNRLYRWRLSLDASDEPATITDVPSFQGFELAGSGKLCLGQRIDPPEILIWDIAAPEFLARTLKTPASPFGVRPRVSPNGRWLAGTAQGQVFLWDLSAEDANAARASLGKPASASNARYLFFSPDSRWLISGTGDGRDTARIWDLSVSNLTVDDAILIGKNLSETVPMFVSLDSRWLFLAGDETIIWDLKQPDHTKPATVLTEIASTKSLYANEALSLSPDTRRLAALFNDNSIRVWDWMTETPTDTSAKILKGHTAAVNSLTFSADGRYLVSNGRDGTIRRWDLRLPNSEPSAIVMPSRRGYPARSLAIGGDGRFVIDKEVGEWDVGDVDAGGTTVRRDWRVTPRIWDFNNAESTVETSVLRRPANWLVRLSPDLKWVQIHGTLWPLAGNQIGATPRLLGSGDEDLVSIHFSADGRRVAARGMHQVFVWDLDADPFKKPIARSHAGATHGGGPHDVSVSRDGRYCVCCLDGGVFAYDLASDDGGKDATLVEKDPASQSGAEFSGDGKWLLTITTAENQSTIRLWSNPFDPRQPKPVWSYQEPTQIHNFAISGDGSWIAAGEKLWKVDEKQNVSEPFSIKGQAFHPSFSSDGQWLSVSGGDGANSGRLFDLTRVDPTANAVLLASEHPRRGETVWSDDGKWLAVAGTDQTIMLWDLDSLRNSTPSPDTSSDRFLTALVLHGQGEWCTDLLFSRDGETLISAWWDGAVRFHELSQHELVEAARIAAGRELTSLERQRFGIDKADEAPPTPNTLKTLAEERPQSWQEALDAPVEVDWNRAPLIDFVDQCGSLFQLPIVIDHDGLNRAGQSYEMLITLSLKQISLRTALELLLEPLGLGFEIRDELLTLTQNSPELRAETAISKGRQAARDELNRMLDQVIEFDCENMPLPFVLEYLGAQLGKNIFYADNPAFGPSRTAAPGSPEVTFEQKTISIREMLNQILPPLKLRLRLHDDLVEIRSDQPSGGRE